MSLVIIGTKGNVLPLQNQREKRKSLSDIAPRDYHPGAVIQHRVPPNIRVKFLSYKSIRDLQTKISH